MSEDMKINQAIEKARKYFLAKVEEKEKALTSKIEKVYEYAPESADKYFRSCIIHEIAVLQQTYEDLVSDLDQQIDMVATNTLLTALSFAQNALIDEQNAVYPLVLSES